MTWTISIDEQMGSYVIFYNKLLDQTQSQCMRGYIQLASGDVLWETKI
jgi:hypothetical protein